MNTTDHRNKLSQQLNDGVAVFTANHRLQSRGDAAYAFAQDATFLYLTGINEPDWRLVIDAASQKSYLVAPETTDIHKIFDGELSRDDAEKLSGIKDIISAKEAEALLQSFSDEKRTVYAIGADPHAEHYNFRLNPAQTELWDVLKMQFGDVADCRKEVAQLRAIKTDEEIALIQQAVDITKDAFHEVKSQLKTARHEYEVEALLTKAFRYTGAEGHAYDPIVASGAHACTLHYGHNNDALPENGLVLIDAGARVKGYAADITRTFAIGEPTERQKAVHATVEKAHHAIVELLRPDLLVKEYGEKVDEIMKGALRELDLLNSEDDYRKYFPHSVSHGLGIDVHDSLGGPETFQPGMVLTVEPGIYISEEGIGVRIEDDILITEDGHRNLSGDLPTSL